MPKALRHRTAVACNERWSRPAEQAHDAAFYQRLHALWLISQGYALNEVSRITGHTRRSLYRWMHRYLQTRRPEDLQTAVRSGRPLMAPAITDECITHALNCKPLEAGYNTTVWTVALLAHYLAEFRGTNRLFIVPDDTAGPHEAHGAALEASALCLY